MTSIYNGYHRGPVTLTPVAERLAVELSLPVFNDLGLSRPEIAGTPISRVVYEFPGSMTTLGRCTVD